jgi:hypothetical protein
MASATAKKRKASDSNGSGARSKDKRIEITKTLNIPSRRNLRRYFSFMDLLQEIKDMVYNEVWNDSNSMVFTPNSLQPQNSSQSPCRVVLRYGESLQDHISPGLPEWVMTNRAFYEKGLKQLLARAKFSWYQDSALPAPRGGLKPKSLPWLNVSQIKELHFHFPNDEGTGQWGVLTATRKTSDAVRELLYKIKSDLKILNTTFSVSLSN